MNIDISAGIEHYSAGELIGWAIIWGYCIVGKWI